MSFDRFEPIINRMEDNTVPDPDVVGLSDTFSSGSFYP